MDVFHSFLFTPHCLCACLAQFSLRNVHKGGLKHHFIFHPVLLNLQVSPSSLSKPVNGRQPRIKAKKTKAVGGVLQTSLLADSTGDSDKLKEVALHPLVF